MAHEPKKLPTPDLKCGGSVIVKERYATGSKELTRTASQWWMSVLTMSPPCTSHTLTVESDDPEMITRSSYWRQRTEPVCPFKTRVQASELRSQTFIVLSLRPDTILVSSY